MSTTELQPVAGTAREITKILPQIARLRHDVVRNRAKIIDLVDAVNALLIPRGWVGIDADGLIHVTYVVRSDDKPRFVMVDGSVPGRPMALSHHADFVWEYSVLSRTVVCVKCRDGSVKEGDTRACDGPV